MTSRRTGSKIELLPSERGKTWTVTETIVVQSRHGKQLTIPVDYEHDEYTFAPNTPDPVPAIAHDYALDLEGSDRKWDDGSEITLEEADDLLLFLMTNSSDPFTRKVARLYHRQVVRFGWIAFHFHTVKRWFKNLFA